MSAKVTVGVPNLSGLTKEMYKSVEKGIENCTDDLLRVATLRSPVDSTTLEKSGTSKVVKSSKSIKGFVSFSAYNKGFNYARKLDKQPFKLGEKSIKKASRGVRSKFSKVSMKVGTGYLTGTAVECQDGYSQHINQLIGYEIAKNGFK